MRHLPQNAPHAVRRPPAPEVRLWSRLDMASVTTNRSWLVPVFALFLATFAVCTAELIIAGLLPAIAHDLDVDIPTAGLLITGYALGVAIAGPILALLTTGVLRRFLLIAVMAVFVAGN